MNITRLRAFVVSATGLMDASPADAMPSAALLAAFTDLVSHDDWLPEACTHAHPDHYQQYLLHCDPLERFSLVSFVWGPGQHTPVHDHGVWGYVGMLRGAETGRRFLRVNQGYEAQGEPIRLEPGDVDILLPAQGDVHQVANAYSDRTSISVHLYGGNIGAIARHAYNPATGEAKPFISGYSSSFVPNLWDRSRD